MDSATKKFVEEQIEKLAIMVAKGFEHAATKEEMGEFRQEVVEMKNVMATKNDIAELKDTIEIGMMKQQQETDGLRDRMRVLETRVDRL